MFETDGGQPSETPGALPGCVADALGAWSKAAGADLSLASEAELYELASTAAAHRSLVQAVEAQALAELDRRGTVGRDHGLTAAKWHAGRTGMPTRAVSDAVTVGGQLLGRFDKVRDALAAGEVSYAHARQIARTANDRIADGLAGQQDRLIANAQAGSFRRWSEDLRERASRLEAEAGHDPQTDPSSNQARFCRHRNGLRGLEVTFTDALGVVVEHLIETEADRRYRAAVKAHKADPTIPVPSRDQLRAEALGDLVRRGAGIPLESSRGPVTEVILVVHDTDPDLEHVTTPDGTHVHPEVAATCACDARVHPIVVDEDGDPLRAGRTTRDPNPAQRRALIVRDGGCVMPGCDAPPAWCHAHHVQWWRRRGPTDIENLALLCRSCHGKIHSKRFTMHADGTGRFTITYPDGHTQPAHQRPRERGNEPPRRAKTKRRQATRRAQPRSRR